MREEINTKSFNDVVADAYSDTMKAFTLWSHDKEDVYYRYVVPPATAPKPGFAIFYTPPVEGPSLVIVGQNPANFAGRRSLTSPPNGAMLDGTVPTQNSYLLDSHDFAVAMRRLFCNHYGLLKNAVGMNVWHFQASSRAASAPRDLRKFCEETTLTLLEAMQPKAILCFGAPAFEVVRRARLVSAHGGTARAWCVAHPTGSWTRETAANDTPAVLDEITAYLNSLEGRPSGMGDAASLKLA